MSVQKIDLPSKELQDEIRSGGVVRPGDRIAVVSVGLGEQVFVVTAVDQDVIRGESVEVPIDEVVTLEKRKVAPVRTGLAIYGGGFSRWYGGRRPVLCRAPAGRVAFCGCGRPVGVRAWHREALLHGFRRVRSVSCPNPGQDPHAAVGG